MKTPTISRIVRGCAVVVAFAAAVLTYRATTWVAAETHATSSPLAWLVPGVVDAGTLIAALLAYLRMTNGERAVIEVGVAGALLTLSVLTQVMDARMHHASSFGQIIAAVPPLVLVAVAELLMREIRRSQAVADAQARRAERAAAKAVQPVMAKRAGAVPDGRAGEAGPSSESGAHTTREERLDHLLAEHGQLTGPLVARALGVSEGHARKIVQRHLADSRAA